MKPACVWWTTVVQQCKEPATCMVQIITKEHHVYESSYCEEHAGKRIALYNSAGEVRKRVPLREDVK